MLINKLCFFTILIGAITCSSCSSRAETRLWTDFDATVQLIQSKKALPIQALQQTVIPSNEPVQIHSEQQIPIILVPVQPSTDIKINRLEIQELTTSFQQSVVDRLLSETLVEIADIQSLIQKKKINEAYEKLTRLQSRYPKLSFLDFIRGSLLFLKGQKDEARMVVEAALKMHPNYEEGRRFLETLKGAR